MQSEQSEQSKQNKQSKLSKHSKPLDVILLLVLKRDIENVQTLYNTRTSKRLKHSSVQAFVRWTLYNPSYIDVQPRTS